MGTVGIAIAGAASPPPSRPQNLGELPVSCGSRTPYVLENTLAPHDRITGAPTPVQALAKHLAMQQMTLRSLDYRMTSAPDGRTVQFAHQGSTGVDSLVQAESFNGHWVVTDAAGCSDTEATR
jgi:hypothetical protein